MISILLAGLLAVSPPRIVLEGAGYFPVLIKLQDGRLAAILRAGAPHIGRGGRLDWITSPDQGRTWTKPATLVDTPEDDRNPAFGQLKSGTVLAAHCILSGYGPDGKLAGARKDRVFDGVYVLRSTDQGRTWSPSKRSPETRRPPGDKNVVSTAVSPYGKIVQLKDGTALMAVYYEALLTDGTPQFQSWVFRSTDDGVTWDEPALIQLDGNETALTVLKDGTVLAAIRTSRAGYLKIARSTDGGRTWAPSIAVTKDAEHPADLVQLRDGRVLMTFGQRNAPRGIHAWFSSDNGLTWKPEHRQTLAADAPNTDCGYPSSVETKRGKITTIYYQVDDLQNAPASAKAKVIEWEAPRR
ncbi:MAG: glycoside hydrolase [Bryobacteraceae bacterium]|nr:glycoside hydrolase [Bryobacteraceae bacterium]